MKNKPISPLGDDWENLRETFLTSEERAVTDVKVALLGEIINARQANGLTQKELGVAVGFDEKSADVRIAQYESGVRKPKDKNISAIADALKVNPKMLGHPDIDFFVCLVQSMF